MDAFLGLINNPIALTVITLLWGLIVKYLPSLKGVPNALIPYLNALIAFLVKLAAPGAAHAQAAAGPVDAHCLLCTVGAAGWQAILSSLIYEFFVRAPSSKVLQKP